MSDSIRLEVQTEEGTQTLYVGPEEASLSLADLLRRHELPLNTRCGQRGLCDGCLIELVDGALIHRTSEHRMVVDGTSSMVRGCEYRLEGERPAQVRIPPASILTYEPEVLSDFRINVPRAIFPLWQQVEFSEAETSSDEAPVDSLLAFLAGHGHSVTALAVDESVRSHLETWNRRIPLFATVECRPDCQFVTEVKPGPATGGWGVAVDVGTTTVVVLIVDLGTGRILGQASGFNRQMALGDDVLTRINLCINAPAMLAELQEAVVDRTIRRLLAVALQQAGEPRRPLVCCTVAANTTMLHLLAGVDPSSMGFAPFTAQFLDHRVVNLDEARPQCEDTAQDTETTHIAHPATDDSVSQGSHSPFQRPNVPVHLLPGAAAYIGADLCAGVLSSGLIYDEGPSLLVDVGTNGEIILKHGDRLSGCATAAGPAFEGARLTSGVRAGSGAISHVRISRNPLCIDLDVIRKEGESHESTKPHGLCGTGYIDVLAEGRRTGLLMPTGRFNMAECEDAADYLVQDETGVRALRIASGTGKRQILVTESDIASLLQAKAAIAAGILTLLEREGVSPAEVRTLYLAGGFGMFLEIPNAIACGLLPGFEPEQIQLVGNTSLAGAYLALLDCGVLHELTGIARRLDIVELNLDPSFESRYIDQLSLP